MRWMVASVVVLFLAGFAWAAGGPGDVDTDFGTGGIFTLEASSSTADSMVWDVQAQADGKLILAGHGASTSASSGYEWLVARLATDGSLDNGFGTGGTVSLFGESGGGGDVATSAYVDGSGRIWVAGAASVASGSGRKQTYKAGARVVRLTSSGSLDTTFGSGGLADLGAMVQALALVPGSGGSVYVVGKGPVASSGSSKGKKGGGSSSLGVVVARLDSSGALDTNYGDGGFATRDLLTSSDDDHPTIHGAALQSDGSLVVLVRLYLSSGLGTVVRFTSSGAVDASFGEPSPSDPVSSMALDSGDRIYLAAKPALDEVAIRRYDADGNLDTSYGTSGVALAIDNGVQTSPLPGTAMNIDADGVLTVGLMELTGSGTINAFAVQLLSSGAPDTSYGPQGDGVSERLQEMSARDAWLQSDGGLVLGGSVAGGSGVPVDWAVGRLAGY